jgi:ADP-heptose:LPS heptosyltransferase/glycosyltransferase involved in cell wall biosynthesis/predicted O-methyltransferase YrrM/sulfatase maturation enzyme AslB (radical SAM superfamily)
MSAKEPFVSVGMTVYNQEPFLGKAISSILAQQYDNFELIISDNASEDGSDETCRSYANKDERITYIRNIINTGPYMNCRKVLDASSGLYYMWASGHDIYHPRFIARLVEEFDRMGQPVALCYPRTVLIDENDKAIQLAPDILDTRGMGVLERFSKVIRELQWGNITNGLMRTSSYRRVVKPMTTIGSDLIHIANISLIGTIAQVDDPLFFRRRNRPDEDGQRAISRQISWFSQTEYESIVPYTLMAYEHVNVVKNAQLDLEDKGKLFKEIVSCFSNRFDLKTEAFRLIAEGTSLLREPNRDEYSKIVVSHEFIRLALICRYFCLESSNILDRFISSCLAFCQHTPSSELLLTSSLLDSAPTGQTRSGNPKNRQQGFGSLTNVYSDDMIQPKATSALAVWKSVVSRQEVRLYAGDVPLMPQYDGWIGLSLFQQDSRHIRQDITNPFPIPDNTVDAFQAEDVFEHIPYEKLVPVMNEIYRILKPGALFRLSVPDYACDILYNRSQKDEQGNILFDPLGGGTPDNPGHLWFPRYETLKTLIEASAFGTQGRVTFLHYYDENQRPITKRIDYSGGHIQRTPDFDSRVQDPYRPISLVVDLTKREYANPAKDNAISSYSIHDSVGNPSAFEFDLYFDLNDGCNLECIMCGGRKKPHKQHVMSFDDFSRHLLTLLRPAASFQFGCQCEPLLVPYFSSAVSSMIDLLEFEAKGRVVTNGSLLNAKKMTSIIDSSIFNKITLSVDSSTSHLYEQIRRGAKFDNLIENIKRLVSYRNSQRSNVAVEFIFTILRINYHQLPDIVRLAADLGINKVATHKCSPNDTTFVDDDFYGKVSIAIEEARMLAQRYCIDFVDPGYQSRSDYDALMACTSYRVPLQCSYRRTSKFAFMIDCHGNLTTPCQRISKPLGNILESTLEEISRSENFLRFTTCIENTDLDACSKCYISEPVLDSLLQDKKASGSGSIERDVHSHQDVRTAEVRSVVPQKEPESSPLKISYVVIVLNGMPFIEPCLKALYRTAHQIIIVEGAVENCMFAAYPDGSSRDGTVEFIRSFPDPAGKLKFIQGCWPEKVDMQNRALELVSGDYVWLVDSDEIYRQDDLLRIIEMLNNDRSIAQVNFIPDNFWKGLDYIFVSPKFFDPINHYRRLFKFVPGARFTSHRPPTLIHPGSSKSTEQMKLVDGFHTRQMGIKPYHYSYVFDSQARQKIELYRRYGWGKGWGIDLESWYNNFFTRWTIENSQELERIYPVWTGDKNSYTVPYNGPHPEVIEDLLQRYPHLTASKTSNAVMQNVVELVKQTLYSFLLEPQVLALETGTIRSYWEKHESTLHLSKTLGRRGKLISVDMSPESIKISKDICNNASNVEWVLSDSLTYLSSLGGKRFHFVLLDSANDKEIIFQEFLRVVPLMQEDGILVIDDAGINTDGLTIDRTTEAQKALKVWEFLCAAGIVFSILESPSGHGTQLTFKLSSANLAKFYSTLTDFNGAANNNDRVTGFSSYREKPHTKTTKVSGRNDKEHNQISHNTNSNRALRIKPHQKSRPTKSNKDEYTSQRRTIKVAGELASHCDLTAVNSESEFARAIAGLFAAARPKKILETGTYLGEGTTRIIASTLKSLGLSDSVFCTIECNPDNYRKATANLTNRSLIEGVHMLHGLSVPRSMLPTIQQIEESCVKNIEFHDIFVDHQEQQRALLYYKETDFPGAADDLLGKVLESFDFRPDFVLLDSAGHMGNIEFNYLVERLRGECYIALDDIRHIKHHRSFKQMQADPQFSILTISDDKFGFCIAKFTPMEETSAGIRHILWVRPDSIGDSILAMAMLPHVQEKYPGAEITVLCQEHISEIYEASPIVKQVIPFDRPRAQQDERYRTAILCRLQELRADLCLNSVYSREPLTDFFAAACGARERVALNGNLSNISADEREINNRYYTTVLPSNGENKGELDRHCDFLKGIGIEVEHLEPSILMTPEDLAFAERIFEHHGLDPKRTLALFAGAQYQVRIYGSYGIALADICRDMDLSVIALGAAADYHINQENLADIGTTTVNLSGTLTLRQSAAILGSCRLAVGAETGLAHIACAVHTPNVILLGGGHFGRFMPYSPLTSVVCLPLECYLCNWQCRYSKVHCVADVDRRVLTAAIKETLRRDSDRPRVFVQDRTLWLPKAGEPGWDLFGRYLNLNTVEVIPFVDGKSPIGSASFSPSNAQLPYSSHRTGLRIA